MEQIQNPKSVSWWLMDCIDLVEHCGLTMKFYGWPRIKQCIVSCCKSLSQPITLKLAFKVYYKFIFSSEKVLWESHFDPKDSVGFYRLEIVEL